jgi:ferric-dicitrate binding protein FerR (iron transport regulator)
MGKNIENIISKFFRNSISNEELELLLNFILKDENYNLFNEYVQINYLSNLSMNQSDKTSLINELESRIKKSKKQAAIKLFVKNLMRVAAVFVGILGVAYFLNYERILIESKNIILTTSSGEKIILDSKSNKRSTNKTSLDKLEGLVNSEINALVYEKDVALQALIKNTIKVPYGKRFKLTLSDGTIVHLNSGSLFTYPVSFIEGKDREVHVSGEAFFDVYSDSLNSFKVYSTGSSAEVFGTKFNFKNYEEDNFSEIILTEGSLGVKNTIDKSEVVIIKPGDLAKVDYSLGKIELSKVNTVLYTSWVDGRIIFRNENINNMITKLERIYDVIIINNNIELNKMFINATFLTEKETIQDVLDYLVKIYNVDYQIMNNKIIIN